MNTKLLSLYGMKWNPFSPDVPLEGVHRTRTVESFSWRVENLAREGGFALVTGAPGSGKSVALRLLVDRLSGLRDLKVGLLSRPQANLADFYRELGDIFGVPLRPHNRWAGAKELREKWQAHIETSLFRPVLVVDEAQEMQSPVLNELRLLCSAHLDSSLLLTTVLAGDGRLVQKLHSDEMLPLSSRIRARLSMDRATPEQLRESLQYALEKAGAPKLMTVELMTTLCEHAAGNMRALMTMADELLAQGAQREARQLDEKLYLELFAVPSPAEPTKKAIAQGGRRR